tara:strand:+ start:19013 stop:20332 length:1320 start_codon:yes stop_codon:yes gene_type:complete
MRETNFDGIVGPSHNYSGLSYGNVASLQFAKDISSPKQAALQGLKKAKTLADMGILQGVIPPQVRPDLLALRNLGFSGTDAEVLQQAYQEDPTLLSICSSSSFMWTANAATVAPSSDTKDGKCHFTVANLRSKAHRAIEPQNTYQSLQQIFCHEDFFRVHSCLELGDAFSDEGAANHTRFESTKTNQALHFFVYGREAMNRQAIQPERFPARQTLEASKAVARRNNIKEELCFFAQQNPAVIDAGVFHNDVISVGYKNVLLYHETAFLNTKATLDELQQRMQGDLIGIRVSLDDVSVEAAVQTYLFNSQIVEPEPGKMVLIAPEHCQQEASVKAFIDKMIADPNNPIEEAHYFDLLQSMKNGGGPACLRLRVALTDEEIAAVNPKCWINDNLYNDLCRWVNEYYRDELNLEDLRDPSFLLQAKEAIQSLHGILGFTRTC